MFWYLPIPQSSHWPDACRYWPLSHTVVGTGLGAGLGTGVGIGLRQGQPELKALLDAAIKQLINDGKLTEFALKYFPFPIHNEKWGDS